MCRRAERSPGSMPALTLSEGSTRHPRTRSYGERSTSSTRSARLTRRRSTTSASTASATSTARSWSGVPGRWPSTAQRKEWTYVNVRRFMNFLRESIEQNLRWVVFEPNDPGLWQRIVRTVSDFLLTQWRAGALFGETPKQAFFVRCDASTNPPADAGSLARSLPRSASRSSSRPSSSSSGFNSRPAAEPREEHSIPDRGTPSPIRKPSRPPWPLPCLDRSFVASC